MLSLRHINSCGCDSSLSGVPMSLSLPCTKNLDKSVSESQCGLLGMIFSSEQRLWQPVRSTVVEGNSTVLSGRMQQLQQRMHATISAGSTGRMLPEASERPLLFFPVQTTATCDV